MTIRESSIQKFKEALAAARADSVWLSKESKFNSERVKVRRELVDFISAFRSGQVTLAKFKEDFDRKTRTDWDYFGLKGMSGAMFLNKLVLHIPDQVTLTSELKLVLECPNDESTGLKKLEAFLGYLNSVITAGVPKRKLQPGRAPFFVSACWHLNDIEKWPVFYESARWVFEQEGLFSPTENSAADYFSLRQVWQNLQKALGLSTWDLESLIRRLNEADTKTVPAQPEPTPEPTVAEPEQAVTVADATPQHVEVQWALAKLGRNLGCKCWIASNDHSKSWNNEAFKSLTLPSLPNLNIGDEAQKLVNLIDVIWIANGNHVIAAFEIESTTSIFSGLLRIADLKISCPNLAIPCYIVVPGSRSQEVIRQLSRPSIQWLELHQSCGFITFEDLMRDMASIARWAKDPTAIRQLAKFVKDSGS